MHHSRRHLAALSLALLLLVSCGGGGTSGSSPSTAGSSGASSSNTSSSPSGSAANPGADSGSSEAAPVLSFEAVDLDGNPVSSESLVSGSRLTMLNVWATYCNPCLQEMPDLGAMAADWDSSEFQIVGIVSDAWQDAPDQVELARDLIEETGAHYTHLLSDSISFLQDVTAVPTTIFLDGDGRILDVKVGSRDRESWEAIIHELLDQM